VHDIEELKSIQNIIPNGYNTIYLNHQFNYYREYMFPKIANQVSHARYFIMLSLKIGNTPF
jgi:hypothetical protein